MVSALEKRLLLTQLKLKVTSPQDCRLCHGPLTSPTPGSPPIRAASPKGDQVDCHPTCLPFACTGCVTKDRMNYGLLDLSNASYESHCALCVHDEEDGAGAGWGGRVTLSFSP